MGATVQQVVETQLKVNDQASAVYDEVAKKAGKAEKATKNLGKEGSSGLSKLSGALGSLEGAFSALLPAAGALSAGLGFKSMLENTQHYIKSIKEVSELTGETAEKTDFMFSSARKAGVEYHSMERVMFQLSRRGAMMEQTMAAATTKVPGMAQKFKRLGVDMSKGPVHSLMTMSAAVKKGKLDAGDLMAQFRIPQQDVNDFKGFLEDLDESKMKAALASGKLIGAKDIANFNRVEDAQHRIADSWNRIQVQVGRRLLPVMADLTEKVSDMLENRWLPAAEKFGSFLAEHMDKILKTAKAVAAVFAGKKALSFASGIVSPGGMLAGMGGGAEGLAALNAAGPALMGVAAAIGVVIQGYKAIQANVDGVRDRIVDVFAHIRARFELIGESLQAIWAKVAAIFGADSDFGKFIGKLAALSFEKLARGVDFFMHVVQTAISFLDELGQQIAFVWKENFAKPWREYVVNPLLQSFRWIAEMANKVMGLFGKGVDIDLGGLKAPIDMWAKHWEKTARETTNRLAMHVVKEPELRRSAPGARPPAPNFDFRNSRFDIKQNFAEGFDADRIAVAFSQDLANLGEMRSQSGFAPIFAAH